MKVAFSKRILPINAVEKNKARVEKIKQLLDDRKSGRSKGSSEHQALRQKLADLRQQFQVTLKKKLTLRNQLDAANKSRETIRASLRELKSTMKYTTVDAIDEAIGKLEYKMTHYSLSLVEEKKALEDIKKLKASRATVDTYSQKLEQLELDDSSRNEMLDTIKQLDDELNALKQEEDSLRDTLSDIRAKETEQGSDFGSLIAERDECREVCKQAYEKIKDIRSQHNAEWAAFKEADALWKLQTAEERKARNEERAAERAAREAERAARLAEMAPEPYDKEVTVCEQLSNYLNKFVTVSNGGAKDDSSKKDIAAPDGFKPFQRKEDTEDAWLLGTGKGSKGGKNAKKVLNSNASNEQKLVHSLDILDAFALLKLEVPTTSSKVAPLLAVVADKKEYYLKLREEAKEQKEKNAENGSPAEEEKEVVEARAVEKQESKKSAKGAKSPALKFDDEKNWPSMGVSSTQEEVGATEAGNNADGCIAVNLSVVEGAGVTVAITL